MERDCTDIALLDNAALTSEITAHPENDCGKHEQNGTINNDGIIEAPRQILGTFFSPRNFFKIERFTLTVFVHTYPVLLIRFFVISPDNFLNKRMSHDITFIETHHGDAVDPVQNLDGLRKPRQLSAFQVSLREIPRHHDF